MTHEDRGHYGDKHTGVTLDKEICELLQPHEKSGTITCAAAHYIATSLNRPAMDIGVQIDLLELRLIECQLGLFGHHPHGKTLDAQHFIAPDLEKKIDDAAVGNRISCDQCWQIASNLKIKRIDVANACEKKEFKIKPCQLGAF